jgi:hypothetical protein
MAPDLLDGTYERLAVTGPEYGAEVPVDLRSVPNLRRVCATSSVTTGADAHPWQVQSEGLPEDHVVRESHSFADLGCVRLRNPCCRHQLVQINARQLGRVLDAE